MLEIGVQSFYRSFSIALLRIRIGFSADPDPAFFVDADPDPGPGFWWLKIEKNYSTKN